MLRLTTLLILSVLAMPLSAASWVSNKGSSLNFSSSVYGEVFSGEFKTFSATVVFSEDDLANSALDVTIDMASAFTANDERDEILLADEFFAAGKFPEARFQAKGFESLGNNRYRSLGKLSIRNVSQNVLFEFSFDPKTQRLQGTAKVKRSAYGVGTGEWADTDLIPDLVQVTTSLILKATQP